MEMDLETVEYTYRHFSWWSVGWREGEDLRRICRCYSKIAVKYNITVNMLINEQVMNDRTRLYIAIPATRVLAFNGLSI